MNLVKTLAAVAALAPLLVASEAGATLQKDIREWSVTCTGGLTCTMTFADWKAKDLNMISFRRTDAPDAGVELRLRPLPDFDGKGDPNGAYSFEIDGKVVLTVPASSLTSDPTDNNLIFADHAKALALLEAMKGGTTMQLRYQGALGTFNLPVKLSGVRGSMLYIDEAQGRLKRKDALEDKGDGEPPKEAAAKDILAIGDLPEVIQGDFTNDSGACSGLDENISYYNGFDIMAGDTRLIVVPCGTGGAYNQPYALYLGYDVIIERISFPDIREDKPSTVSTAYNIDFDPKTKIFTSFFRGRGIGDCGLWYKWKLTDAGGPALVLLEERRKDDCDENDMGGPQNFPLVWPVHP